MSLNPRLDTESFPSPSEKLLAVKRSALGLWQEPSGPPDGGCVHQLFEAQVERTPDAPALCCGNRVLSYGELNAQANRLARHLIRKGVRPETRVGIALGSSPSLLVALLATLKSGATCLPLDLNYPKQRLEHMAADAQPAVIVTEKSAAFALSSQHATTLVDLHEIGSELLEEDCANLSNVVSAEAAAYVIYTSGSTGKPRGVLLPHRGLANHNLAAIELYQLRPADRVLQFSSISFDIAIEEIFPSLASGATVVLKDDSFSLQANEFLCWIREREVTVLDLPTAYWHELMYQLETVPGAELPGSLRMVILGGEKASARSYRIWRGLAGDRVRLINTYGPTEASVIVSGFEPACWPELEFGDSLPLGLPVAGAKLYVLNTDLTPVAPGEPGELYIGGIPVARGYLNQPELTKQRFIQDPFSEDPLARLYKTGDVVRSLPNGVLEFVGRVDYQVKIRGFRVEPGEVEAVLNQYPGIRESVVLSQENGNSEKCLVAYLVWKREAKPASSNELRSFIAQQLPEYMVPSAFTVLAGLPLSPNGKVDRHALPRPALEAVEEDVRPDSRDGLEAQILRIWQSSLGRKGIGVDENFFQLGGHSLLAARVMYRLGQELGVTLPLALLLGAPTVRALAAKLRQDKWSRSWFSLVPIQPKGSRPPFFCVHGVGGNVIGFQQLGSLMSPEQPFYGLQAQGLDGQRPCFKSVEEMAEHYIREIRTVQPVAPYYLGGFSFGGLVAYEMAQQLRAAGEDVSLLVLFDTYPGNLKPLAESVVALWRISSLREVTRSIWRSFRRRLNMWLLPPVLKNVFLSNMRAASQYKLQPYPGNVVLFRATEKSLRAEDNPHAAWNGLIQGTLDIDQIAGDHGGILVQPQVKDLARRLQVRIDSSAGC